MSAPLEAARESGVLTLTLNRPDKRNALSSALVEALHGALDSADLDAEVRVVVLTGAGKDFCAGADLEELLASADASPEANEASALRLGSLFTRMRSLPKPVIAVVRGRALAGGAHPDVSVLGMALAVWSLVTMPLLGIAKQRIADEIGSAATKGEGRQNLLCAYLAGALLVGLAGNAIAGAWWLDQVVGLLIAAVAVKEGAEAWRGEGCCVASPLDGYDACDDDCCR